jgi:hypothetical protein
MLNLFQHPIGQVCAWFTLYVQTFRMRCRNKFGMTGRLLKDIQLHQLFPQRFCIRKMD